MGRNGKRIFIIAVTIFLECTFKYTSLHIMVMLIFVISSAYLILYQLTKCVQKTWRVRSSSFEMLNGVYQTEVEYKYANMPFQYCAVHFDDTITRIIYNALLCLLPFQ